jgi:hypothetical protein
MQHSPLARRVLGTLPFGVSLEVGLDPSQIKAEPDGLLLETLRANLHAAARHIALGHAGPSFRECAGAACIEATKLIPELDPVEGAATDAELDAILDGVLISLEREGASFFAPKPS